MEIHYDSFFIKMYLYPVPSLAQTFHEKRPQVSVIYPCDCRGLFPCLRWNLCPILSFASQKSPILQGKIFTPESCSHGMRSKCAFLTREKQGTVTITFGNFRFMLDNQLKIHQYRTTELVHNGTSFWFRMAFAKF